MQHPPPAPRSRWPWMMIVPFGLLALLVFAGLTVARVAGSVHVHEHSRDDVSIDIPGGRIDIRGRDQIDPGSLGIEIYPGAVRLEKGGTATFSWSSDDGSAEKVLAVGGTQYRTGDSAARVVDWYKAQLPSWIVVRDGEGTRLERKDGGAKRFVVIREKPEGTVIGVATAGEPGSN